MPTNPKVATWIGWILTVPPAGLLIFSAAMKILGCSAEVTKAFVETFGYPAAVIRTLGIVEAVCAILFLIPRTAVLGAVLVTGYLGGAIATHVRISDQFIMPALLGVVVWLALFLRDPRVRDLLPIRRGTAPRTI